MKKWLNLGKFGLHENANGFPVVRRDYAQAKQRKPIATNDSDWVSNAFKA
ncbi:hypothetical protein P2H88_13060 [Mannheimia haemolytica]|nr:hypothetical protein [Mannheimia haemolytica]